MPSAYTDARKKEEGPEIIGVTELPFETTVGCDPGQPPRSPINECRKSTKPSEFKSAPADPAAASWATPSGLVTYLCLLEG